MEKKQVIQDYLKKHLVINTQDASELLGSKMAISRLVDKEVIERVEGAGKIGLYCLPETNTEAMGFAALSHYYSNCVVSGITCLRLLGLGQDFIDKIHVDIPYPKDMKNQLFEVHRVSPERINNVMVKSFEDKGIIFPIKIYSPERALHEAYKYYGGTDAFYRAIKRYSTMYLDRKLPAKSYEIIRSIDEKVGQKIIELLALGDVNE